MILIEKKKLDLHIIQHNNVCIIKYISYLHIIQHNNVCIIKYFIFTYYTA